jgi:hypothetical protein
MSSHRGSETVLLRRRRESAASISESVPIGQIHEQKAFLASRPTAITRSRITRPAGCTGCTSPVATR